MKTEKKRSFKGAVLLTVVSVMSLLIVFLTSTLVLAVSANNRAHKSYSSSQANYTARAVVDSVLAAIKSDTTFAHSVGSVNASNTPLTVNIKLDSAVTGVGKIDKALVQYEGTQKFFDSDQNEWIDKDLLSVSADVLYGGETKTVKAYLLKNPPSNVNNSGGGGGFVTVGSATLGNHTNSFGGTYLGIGMGTSTRLYCGTYPGGVEVSLNQRLYLNVLDGNPIEELSDGTEGYNVYKDIGKNSGTMITVFSPHNNQTFEAPVTINGNFYIGNHSQLIIPTKKSGMSIWGNMTVSNSFDVSSVNVNIENNYKRRPDESDDDYNARKKLAIESFNEVPYIYVDGEVSLNEGITFGKDYLPLNLFAGRIRQYTDNASTMYANIYCQDENETSVLKGNGGGTKLYKFSDSVINQTEGLPPSVRGNFYTKGSLQINGMVDIDGDLIVEHDLIIENGSKLSVGGDVVIGGTLKCDGELNTSSDIRASFAYGSKITSDATKKKADDGSDLYYRKETKVYRVLAKNIGFVESWGATNNYEYAWLKPEAATVYSLPDSDGDGIIDGNVHNFEGFEVDPDLILSKGNKGSMIPWDKDETNLTNYTTEVKWVNQYDETDVTTNESDTYEPGGNFKYNGFKDIVSPELYKSMHDGVIFPKQAERAVVLGLDSSVDRKSTQVVRTVDEIEGDYQFGTKAITSIPPDSSDPTKLKTDAQIFTDGNLPAVINGDCTLQGVFNGKDIVIQASASETWVKLASGFGLMNGARIIYDDTTGAGELKLFVEGKVSMDGNGGGILTKTYDEALFHSTDEYQISIYDNIKKKPGVKELYFPRITIYSRKPAEGEEKPSIQINNMGAVTASIEAPYMDFVIQDVKQFTASKLYYNGQDLLDLADKNNRRVGVIGTLNVGELKSAVNNWDFLYVPRGIESPPLTITPPGGEDLKFVVTYYEGF